MMPLYYLYGILHFAIVFIKQKLKPPRGESKNLLGFSPDCPDPKVTAVSLRGRPKEVEKIFA